MKVDEARVDFALNRTPWRRAVPAGRIVSPQGKVAVPCVRDCPILRHELAYDRVRCSGGGWLVPCTRFRLRSATVLPC